MADGSTAANQVSSQKSEVVGDWLGLYLFTASATA